MKIINQKITDQYALYHGDCVYALRGLPSNSLHLGVTSVPFPGMYVYSNSVLDMGNVTGISEMIEQCRYMSRELLRCMVPGRSFFIHLTQGVAQKLRDGYMGLKDFRGAMIQMMIDEGWIHYGETVIDKDPQALRNGSKVLTPDGWEVIEYLTVGDFVIGSDGKPQKVKNVFPFESRPMYRITFTDGSEIDCDAGHLWNVRTEGLRYTTGQWMTKTTKELAEGWVSPTGRLQYEIPLVSQPVEFSSDETLPIDSYLLGVLLGDGAFTSRSSLSFCVEHEIANKLNLPDGCQIRKQGDIDYDNGNVAVYFINCKDQKNNPVIDGLRSLGIYGLRAWEKSIPDSYKMASVEDRKNLLRGLLDTDGTIKKNNSIIFCSTSYQLAQDVIWLVRSLGGLGLLRVEDGHRYIHNGEDRIGRVQYMVTVQLNQDWCPFSLSNKVARWTQRDRQIRRKIVNIEIVDNSECTCIEVENEDGLFVIEDFVLTHNCKAMRTKDHGLMFKSLVNDSAKMHCAMPDFLLQFQKPGGNPLPITAGYGGKYENSEGWVSNYEWILWARPVWYAQDYEPGTWRSNHNGDALPTGHGIRETDVLNVSQARDTNDERHLCPLQLGVIHRLVNVWSAPGEVVFDPFNGIGSTGYVAIKNNRRYVGSELKQSYYQSSVRNLDNVVLQMSQLEMFEDYEAVKV